jgi:methyltransferase
MVALVALERVFELWLSRRNARRLSLSMPGAVEAGAAHTRVMGFFHAAVLLGCALEGRRARKRRWALLPLLGAQALRYWAAASLGDRWNVRVLVVPGAPPVTKGPYRFVRHPNYLAVIVEMLALPIYCGAPRTAVFATLGNALLLAGRIRIEEGALGGAYAAAFAGRPRFLPSRRSHVGSGNPAGNPAHRA